MSDSTRQFFDQLSPDYSAAIERCAPRYREMLWAVLHYLPDNFRPRRILELGCGSGNLSELLARRFPEARLELVDISGSLLAQCRERLGEEERFCYRQADFGQIDYAGGSLDLVTSSIAVHHLADGAKRRLFFRIFRWLAPGGWFSFSDQFSAATSDAYRKHVEGWRREALALGCGEKDWDLWMRHQDEHDHHATLVEQIDWLRTAGFATIDCPWRYLLWTVLQARK